MITITYKQRVAISVVLLLLLVIGGFWLKQQWVVWVCVITVLAMVLFAKFK
jgi:diacylglycerol kinase